MSQLHCDHFPGPEPAIVLIHGWTCRRSDWEAQIAHLRDRHELLALDLPGHGDTPPDEREEWSIQAFADDVVTAIDRLQAKDVILVGHSMGGTVALETALRLPERVRGVILADTFLINYGALDEATVAGFYDPFAGDFRGAMSDLVENTTDPGTSQALKDRLKTAMGSADPAWALPAWRHLLEWDPQPVFEQIRCPVHAINCPLVPDTTRERLAPHMSDTVIPDSGHFLPLEAPEAFNRALDDTITRMR